MSYNNQEVYKFVDFLNSLLEIDPEAVNVIFNGSYFPCNKKLANHPTVQVTLDEEHNTVVRTLGILNGYFGINREGHGPIRMILEDDLSKIIRFEVNK